MTTTIANEVIETLENNTNNFFVADNDNDTAAEDLVHSTLDDISFGIHTFYMELLEECIGNNTNESVSEIACNYLEAIVFSDLSREISVMI